MSDNERSSSRKAGELDRRSVLVGTAATAATAASLPDAAIAKGVGPLSATYGGYSANFSEKFFNNGQEVVYSVRNIKKRYKEKYGVDPVALQWGTYQKWAPDNPDDPDQWDQKHDGSGQVLYDRWESAIDEAREDLAKLPAPDYSPDPDKPGDRASNMLDHLDRAVTIALLQKYQGNQNSPNSGIPVEVKVGWKAKKSRRHLLGTTWVAEPFGFGQYNCKRLKIDMTCPSGGWSGTALWKSYSPQQQGDIRRFTATFTVPPKPAKNCDQILFIFHGLESVPGGTNVPAILQPVLQWTNEPDAAGNPGTWAIRSWYVPANYDAPFDEMPKLDQEAPFQDYNKPAWTKATRVNPRDVLHGLIEWIADATHGAWYRSSFLNYPKTALDAKDITKLTYPVAVIEAYMPPPGGNQPPTPVPRDGLVSLVTMTDVLLTSTNTVPPKPDWYVGTASTNKLKRYDVDAQVDNATEVATITFTLGSSKAKGSAVDMSPPWVPSDKT